MKMPLFFRETAHDECLRPTSPPLPLNATAVVYIRANGRLPDAKGLTVYQWKRVVNMGTQPLS